ncbi:hypothetical protein [Oenococcus sp.]|uniref:hypothetical protein n=1 Tax=Oenococcus sp. TaxID=1979414 RepID=UPI0039E9026C
MNKEVRIQVEDQYWLDKYNDGSDHRFENNEIIPPDQVASLSMSLRAFNFMVVKGVAIWLVEEQTLNL